MKVISLDIETYGAVERDEHGPLPPQTCFHPAMMSYVDGMPPARMILTIAITLADREIRSLSIDELAQLRPAETMVFNYRDKQERSWAHRWINEADVLIGQNLLFDVSTLRFCSSSFQRTLAPRSRKIVDLSVLNYLHDETRMEKSLKAIGPLFSLFSYDHTLKKGDRFKGPRDPLFLSYAAQDTHNTMLAVAELSRRLRTDHGEACDSLHPILLPTEGTSYKGTEFCLEWYSRLFWTVLHMQEAGVPIDLSRLQDLENRIQPRLDEIAEKLATHDIKVAGKDTVKSLDRFVNYVCAVIDGIADPHSYDSSLEPYENVEIEQSIRDDPLLERTDKTNKIALRDSNRALLLQKLPQDCRCTYLMEEWGEHRELDKVVGSYIYPILRHKRRDPCNRTSIAIPTSCSERRTPPSFPDSSPSSKASARSSETISCDLSRSSPSTATPTSATTTTTSSTSSSPAETSSTTATTRWRPPSTSSSTSSPSSWMPPSASSTCSTQTPASSATRLECSTASDTFCLELPCSPSPTTSPRSSTETASSTTSSRTIPPTSSPTASSTDAVLFPTYYITPSSVKDDAGSLGGTKQGRITAKNPAVQTFPSDIKDCIRPPYGQVMIWADLSQIELRVAAVLSGEPTLIEAYNWDLDLHTQRASRIFGCDEHLVTKANRQVGKMVNFADLFRSGPSTMQGQVMAMTGSRFPLAFFQEIARDRPRARPVLWKWQDELIAAAHARGKLEIAPIGQSRYYLGGDKFDENEIVNQPVQTHAANVFLDIQGTLVESLPAPIRMRTNIYDAMLVTAPVGLASEARRLVERAVSICEETGYWNMLCSTTGHLIRLKCEVKMVE